MASLLEVLGTAAAAAGACSLVIVDTCQRRLPISVQLSERGEHPAAGVGWAQHRPAPTGAGKDGTPTLGCSALPGWWLWLSWDFPRGCGLGAALSGSQEMRMVECGEAWEDAGCVGSLHELLNWDLGIHWRR